MIYLSSAFSYNFKKFGIARYASGELLAEQKCSPRWWKCSLKPSNLSYHFSLLFRKRKIFNFFLKTLDNAVISRYNTGTKKLGDVEMEKQMTAKQRARQKYEIVHKEERDMATRQFNTRLPVKEYEEITSFLKSKRIRKVDLIRIGYQALMQEFKKEK